MDFATQALKVSKAVPQPYDKEAIQKDQQERFKQERLNRMAYDLVRERRELEENAFLYDKIKWPAYKDTVFRRRQIANLPGYNRQVNKLVGLKHAPALPSL